MSRIRCPIRLTGSVARACRLRLDGLSDGRYGRPKFVVFLWFLFQETLFRYSPGSRDYGFRRLVAQIVRV